MRFKLSGNSSGILNIVDLSELAMERSKTARDAIITMGNLAETYGYNDNGESLFVSDSVESFVFHHNSGRHEKSAVWVAEVIPPNHAAVVANSFIIHDIDLEDKKGEKFCSHQILLMLPFIRDFGIKSFHLILIRYILVQARISIHPRRRMWYAFKLLGVDQLPPIYDNLQVQQPYNTSYQIPSIPEKAE